MFYSQFILAKKGPLGTIWIAAHLERKLRKNQVADTDIGISVDSILFPEVPIALRLSSHLLLGVVRIYSRKVNYLFDDCSEALLKIKQAFRSTAVDLPPEESTAPYHSITLPETFDLDDFELPDSALFHGNFVDHHISTRDQITLQDTMDGMVYSTSQFGLDERFGDGDALQIGLDLDEELLLDKTSSPQNASIPFDSKDDMDPQTSSQQVGLMDVDGNENSQVIPEFLSSGCGDDVQTPDPNEEFPHEPIDGPDVMDVEKCNVTQARVPSLDLPESAQAPSTPLLTEEALPANVQGASTLLRKDPLDNDAESLITDVSGSSPIEPVDPLSTKSLSSGKPESDAPPNKLPLECGEDRTGILQNGDICVQNPPIDQGVENPPVGQALNNAEDVVPLTDLGSTGPSDLENIEPRDCSMIDIVSNNEPIKEAENAVRVTGDDCCSPNASTVNLEVPQMPETMLSEISVYNNESNEHLTTDLASNDIQLGSSKWSASSDIPEPEKFLLAPAANSDLPSNLEVQTNDKEADVEGRGDLDRSRSLSRKRHSLMDSSPFQQNGDSSQFSGLLGSKTSTDYIPDDDDILASILVGRRTPVLKMISTPPEVATSKRRRLASRVSATKRKVLSDDTLVLHGDVIRQQLTNTEEIRRLRRKAPCTRLDIWMIQKYLLEEEIFSEPLSTGMSLELTGSMSQTFIRSEVGVAHIDPEDSVPNKDGNDAQRVHNSNSVISKESDNEAKEATEAVGQNENPPSEPSITSCVCDHQADLEAPTDVPQINSSEDGKFQEVAALEIETRDDGTILGVEMSMMAAAHPREDYVSIDLGTESPSAGAYKEMSASLMNGLCLSPDHKSATQPVDDIGDTGNGALYSTDSKVADKDACVVDVTGDNTISTVEDASISYNASILEENKGGISADVVPNNHPQEFDDEIKQISEGELALPVNGSADSGIDIRADSLILSGGINPSIPDVFVESDGLTRACIVADSQAIGRIKDSEVEDAVEDVFPAKEGMSGEDIATTDANQTEWPHLVSCSSQLNMDMEDEPPNEANLGCQTGNDEPLCEYDGFDRIWADNDTDFLNADDDIDDPVEEEDNNEPGAEEHRLYDNSGWSSRTRAVANYLKYMFDNGGGGHDRKVVSVNNLLAGKTRKEASRMFFETLVLKTKDYIHVEQDNPFENISIQPRGKLMKSEF